MRMPRIHFYLAISVPPCSLCSQSVFHCLVSALTLQYDINTVWGNENSVTISYNCHRHTTQGNILEERMFTYLKTETSSWKQSPSSLRSKPTLIVKQTPIIYFQLIEDKIQQDKIFMVEYTYLCWLLLFPAQHRFQ